MRNSLPLWLALALSAALSVAAAVSGWQRGGNWLESMLWAFLSILAVLIAHLLPALLHHRPALSAMAAPVWLGIFAVVVFGHAQFFTLAEMHAGRERLESLSTTAQDTPPASSTGRTTTVIARDLSRAAAALPRLPEAKRPVQREAIAALQTELDTAKQQASQQSADKAQQHAAGEAVKTDPVGHRLGQALGVKAEGVMLAVSVFTALVLELASVILWRLALVAGTPAAQQGIPLAGWLSSLRHTLAPRWTATPASVTTALTTAASEAPEQPAATPTEAPPPAPNPDAAAILALLKAKGAIPLAMLRAGVSSRLRPALSDLLDDLQQAGLVQISEEGRTRMVRLTSGGAA